MNAIHAPVILRMTTPEGTPHEITEVQVVCPCGFRAALLPTATDQDCIDVAQAHMASVALPHNAPLAPASPQGRGNPNPPKETKEIPDESA